MTGGENGRSLMSTEILIEGEGNWNDVGNLPTAVSGIKGVSLFNKVFMTGHTICY